MNWSTADGRLMTLTLICAVLAVLCLAASIGAWIVEIRAEREWNAYLDETYPEGRGLE